MVKSKILPYKLAYLRMVKIFDHVKKILNMVEKIELPDGLGKSKPFSTASTYYFCKKLCSNKLKKKNNLLLRSFLLM